MRKSSDTLRLWTFATFLLSAALLVLGAIAGGMLGNELAGGKPTSWDPYRSPDGSQKVFIELTVDQVSPNSNMLSGRASLVLEGFAAQAARLNETESATVSITGIAGNALTWVVGARAFTANGLAILDSKDVQIQTAASSYGRFPLDSYEIRLLTDVSFGGAWSGLDDEFRSSKAIQGILPVRIDMESIPQGWSLKRSDLDGYTLKLGDYGRTRLAREVTFTLTRGSANKLFIFTLLSCPLLILAAFAWKGLQQVREGMNGLSPLELASTLLALLAMRQVLVPTDIPGFTIADKILGIELTVTVAVAVVLYVWPTRVAAAPVVVEAESPRLVVVQFVGAADKNTHWHSKGAISRGDERAGRRVQ